MTLTFQEKQTKQQHPPSTYYPAQLQLNLCWAIYISDKVQSVPKSKLGFFLQKQVTAASAVTQRQQFQCVAITN